MNIILYLEVCAFINKLSIDDLKAIAYLLNINCN